MGIFGSRPTKSSRDRTYIDEYPSSFESFPREIAWKIFEYAPESVFDLRLTCPIIRDLVDEFAQQRQAIQLVDELTIYGPRSPIAPFQVLVVIEVPKPRSKLFELRLRLSRPTGRCKKIERKEDHVLNTRASSYNITLNPHDFDEPFLRSVGRSIGGRMGKLALLGCRENTFGIASKLLEGNEFSKMEFRTRRLTEENASQLLATVKTGKVEQVHLAIYNAEDCDSVKILKELSLLVRTIRIAQMYIGAGHVSYLLGHTDVDWSSVILDLFSGKLDKLWINNQWFPAYLPLASADRLRERLPAIGKNVWFTATCNVYADGIRDIVNEHTIRADHATDISNTSQPRCASILNIVHSSREHEQFED